MAEQQQQYVMGPKAQLVASLEVLLQGYPAAVIRDAAVAVLQLDAEACAGLLAVSEDMRRDAVLKQAGDPGVVAPCCPAIQQQLHLAHTPAGTHAHANPHCTLCHLHVPSTPVTCSCGRAIHSHRGRSSSSSR
jgi:hypothetical protein